AGRCEAGQGQEGQEGQEGRGWRCGRWRRGRWRRDQEVTRLLRFEVWKPPGRKRPGGFLLRGLIAGAGEHDADDDEGHAGDAQRDVAVRSERAVPRRDRVAEREREGEQ